MSGSASLPLLLWVSTVCWAAVGKRYPGQWLEERRLTTCRGGRSIESDGSMIRWDGKNIICVSSTGTHDYHSGNDSSAILPIIPTPSTRDALLRKNNVVSLIGKSFRGSISTTNSNALGGLQVQLLGAVLASAHVPDWTELTPSAS